MKTILILSNSGGGLLSFRKEVIAALCQNYRVVISVPNAQGKEQLEDLGATVISSKMERRSKNPFKDLNLLKQYENTIMAQKPDLVLTYTIKPNVYGGWACQKFNIPYIANITGLGTTIENGGMLSRISLGLYKKGLRRAACAFFQNETNHKIFVEKGIVSGKTRTIPGSGVNLEEHPVQEYPNETSPVRFLFIGRIMKDKGIEELLYAVKKLKKQGYDIVLDIIGGFDENYKQEIDNAVKDGYVYYYGYQKDVNLFIKKSHCVVLPSYHEGMSNVMLEAASSARPVITTNVPGCRETFDEGVTGFGCEAKSGESLAEVMKKFILIPNEKRAEMGLLGRKKVEGEFNRHLIIDAYLEEIRIALKE